MLQFCPGPKAPYSLNLLHAELFQEWRIKTDALQSVNRQRISNDLAHAVDFCICRCLSYQRARVGGNRDINAECTRKVPEVLKLAPIPDGLRIRRWKGIAVLVISTPTVRAIRARAFNCGPY